MRGGAGWRASKATRVLGSSMIGRDRVLQLVDGFVRKTFGYLGRGDLDPISFMHLDQAPIASAAPEVPGISTRSCR